MHCLSRSNFLTTGRSSIFFFFKIPFYLRTLKVMGKLNHSFNVQNDHETITGRHLSHLHCQIFSASKVIYMAAQSIKSAQHHHKCMYKYDHTSLVKFCYTKTVVITTWQNYYRADIYIVCLPAMFPWKSLLGDTKEYIRGQSNFLCSCPHTDLILYMLFAVTYFFFRYIISRR